MATSSVTLYKHRAYGTGCPTLQSRTIVGFQQKGRQVLYVAGDVPVAGDSQAGFRIPGKTYSCARSAFLAWLKKIDTLSA